MEHNDNCIKIVFVCSSLEPGRDGVGDYCRRLAAELIKQGHQCGMLSVFERHISVSVEEVQQLDDSAIPVLRLPSPGLSNADNLVKAGNWLNHYDPQWLSLQFVTFGYHPRGLNFGLGKQLRGLSAGRSWHIMFHELWVGMAKEESIKLHVWGKVQKYLIRRLIKTLQPKAIQTQTHLYQQLLGQMGIDAGYLPLFSNVPVYEPVSKNPAAGLTFVVFGTIHSGAPIAQLAKDAAAYSKQHNLPAMLTFIGRCGAEQDRWAAIWQEAGLPFKILGEQPVANISATLSNATMGISATALAVVEKSGSFAAMKEHSLPVLSLSKPWTPIGVAPPAVPDGIVVYNNNLTECLAFKANSITCNSVSDVSVKFADTLTSAKSS